MVLVMCSLQILAAQGQEKYWQQQVNYVIDVSLNDIEHTLDGYEKLEYSNHSPDTLHFIWFHLWPNAFKNDKTAFSEQLLLNNRTDFYFSDKEQKGYINRLDFKVNGVTAKLEDHPVNIDIVKLILPNPLAPGETIGITTSFHVKLPYNFSRGGHVKQSYQVTQWYPKPAVYDRKGWHPMPYVDQGEFYSEFGNYDVRISLPANYVVAATGEIQNVEEKSWLKQRPGRQSVKNPTDPKLQPVFPASSSQTKSLRYIQHNVHDFAWFADKRFLVDYDTLGLDSGKSIELYSYYLPSGASTWKNSISFMKDAIRTRSNWLGEYPFNVVSAVEAEMGFSGGMEYPTITCISPMKSEKNLDITLAHEIGHNWLYGILATNERLHPWMDEGMNTFYDDRYSRLKYPDGKRSANDFIAKRIPPDPQRLILETITTLKKDQPVYTSSENFNEVNYQLIAYVKASEWMKRLEDHIGREMFDSCMHAYYDQWQFKHPYPEDFKKIMETISRKNLDNLFNNLERKGSLIRNTQTKTLQLASFFNLKDTFKKNYLSVLPAIGANMYDGFMVGGLVHNYQLPLQRFRLIVAPLYATRSKRLNGITRVSYTWYPDHFPYRIDAGAGAARFSLNEYQPELKPKQIYTFQKLAPFIRVTLNESPLTKVERYIQLKSYFIREQGPSFSTIITGNDTSEQVNTVTEGRNLNQLKMVVENRRVLYPYKGELQVEQQNDFIRTTFTGRYYFNYANRQGGMNVRLFAGKFLYSGAKTQSKQFETNRYHLNMTGADGFEDYTYTNYFVGRNQFENLGAQQIMIRDGGFKVRTDLLSNKIGRTDNWLIAANAVTDVPKKLNPFQVLPVNIPLKIFADIGTYAEAWKENAETNRFLFDAGFQIALFKETVNIYVPVIFSTVYRDYFRSTLGSKRFWKTISFSIDIQDFSLQKINKNLPF